MGATKTDLFSVDQNELAEFAKFWVILRESQSYIYSAKKINAINGNTLWMKLV